MPGRKPRPARRLVAALGLAGALGIVLASAEAAAYVRYTSDSGCPYGWRSRSVPVVLYPRGLTSMTVEEITNATAQAVGAWTKNSPALGGCTDLDLPLTAKSVDDVPSAAKYDHINNVLIQATTWCTTLDNGYLDCHDQSALAITSVFATTWGQIVDADIEVNAVYFTWGNLDSPMPGGMQDLQNALTHEAGHFIGLDHTCYDPGGISGRPRPKDQNGADIPLCSQVAPTDPVHATTMFASADPGDISKRTLEADDRQAVCDIYRAGTSEYLAACAVQDQSSGGCAVAGASPAAEDSGTRPAPQTRLAYGLAAGLSVVGLALAVRRWRRRR